MHQNQNQNKIHIPVLLEEVLQYLDPKPGNTYLDLTAGYGGHAERVLEKTLGAHSVLVDRDKNAVDYLKQKFDQKSAVIRHQDFYQASLDLSKEGTQFDLILADLGVSSPHLNIPERGFAFQMAGPLDMRMDQGQVLTAEKIVNSYSEADLADLIYRYGEEPRSRVIARQLVLNRPFHTTQQLAECVAKAKSHGGGSKRRAHPATQVFQALRVAVNDELGQLSESLPLWIEKLLSPNGRLVVISFHSLEDRLVKQIFSEYGQVGYDADIQILTKRPVVASPNELVFNPRARSAKLRAAAKINK